MKGSEMGEKKKRSSFADTKVISQKLESCGPLLSSPFFGYLVVFDRASNSAVERE